MVIFSRRLIASFFLLAICVFFLAYRSYRAFHRIAQEQLVVGMIIGYAPYAVLNASGNYEGFDVDVALAIAQKLHKELVIKDMDLSALFIALEQGKVDMIMSGLCITSEREVRVNMVHYAGDTVTAFPLVFWKSIPRGISSLDDLLVDDPQGLICVESGSTQEKYLATRVASENILHIESMADIIINLRYGKVIAAFMDPHILPSFKKQAPELVSIDVDLPLAFQTHGIGIAISKRNSELTSKMQAIVTALKNDSTIQKAEQIWLS